MKLFIPGPTQVHPDVLAAMARPPISHRGEEMTALQRRIDAMAARIFFTAHPILLSTSSATGLMEGALRNIAPKRVLSLVCGAFTERWHRIALDCGFEADRLEVPLGEAIEADALDRALSSGRYDTVTVAHSETSTGVANPLAGLAGVMRKHPEVFFLVDTVSSLGGMEVRVDAMGIDVCLASVQKALALPPGFALCSVSPRVLERSRKAAGKGFYFDFARIAEKAAKGQPLITPSLPHMFAMEVQFERILKEGMEARWARHRAMAGFVRSWAKRHFALVPREERCSDTVTCVRNSRAIDVPGLIGSLKAEGCLIGNGYGDLKDKAFRIAHLGELTIDDLADLLSRIDRILGLPAGAPS